MTTPRLVRALLLLAARMLPRTLQTRRMADTRRVDGLSASQRALLHRNLQAMVRPKVA